MAPSGFFFLQQFCTHLQNYGGLLACTLFQSLLLSGDISLKVSFLLSLFENSCLVDIAYDFFLAFFFFFLTVCCMTLNQYASNGA